MPAPRMHALYVNLFLASELRWREQGLRLRQVTRFPQEERTRLELALDAPRRFALRVRRPEWAAAGFRVSVNGSTAEVTGGPSAYVSLESEWHDGDVVEVELPTSLRAETMPDDASVVAFLRGPIVLAADLGASGIDVAKRFGPTNPELRTDDATALLPTLVASSPSEALARLRPAGEPLTFRSEGIGRPADVTLRPFYALYDRRHSVYLRVETEAAAARRETDARDTDVARRAVDARTVDSVVVGAPADEQAHALEHERAGAWSLEGRSCRSTRYGGWFGYRLRLPEAGPAALRVTYWGGETRRHSFDVTAEGETLRHPSRSSTTARESFYEVEYALPERLTRGRDALRIAFRTGPHQSTGAIFEVRTVRPARSSPSHLSGGARPRRHRPTRPTRPGGSPLRRLPNQLKVTVCVWPPSLVDVRETRVFAAICVTSAALATE